ncbi:MAG TPA: hypothetical protein VE974_28460 [Thermoanaerobaculia bacterium]|nr:hypothetical protein [Thermoanaerobaculia bacterium]
MRNDARDFALRLYARIPAQYRVYDEAQRLPDDLPDQHRGPLFALITVIAEQVANVRENLDQLWDDFFIETCADWVVPYLGALVGTNLVQLPVGRGNRLEVRDTVRWRRSRGTVRMLREVVSATTGWPCDVAEFFQHLGWSQNMNHRRLDDPLTPDLRDVYPLSLLGRANDPLSHAADFRPATDLEQARIRGPLTSPGVLAWGTPGRYEIPSLGFFVRRLQPFRLHGVTPADASPAKPPALPGAFTFDPLFHDVPLFEEQTAAPITREAFDRDPWQTFGPELAVRWRGLLLAADAEPRPSLSASRTLFTFGGRPNVSLQATNGMRLMDTRDFEPGGAHFLITAEWNGSPMGMLSTLYAARRRPEAYQPGNAAGGLGALAISVQLGGEGSWPTSVTLPGSIAARFPGAVVAVEAQPDAMLRQSDALYVYLPQVYLRPGDKQTFFVAADGSTYTTPALDATALARASEGSVYPPRATTTGTAPASAFLRLDRKEHGIFVPDQGRLGGAQAVFTVSLCTGLPFQPLGGIASIAQAAADYPDLAAPEPWPAFTYAPSTKALNDDLPDDALLAVNIRPLGGTTRVPPTELVIANRRGESLLVYLPEVDNPPPEGVDLFVASDGATWFAPSDEPGRRAVLEAQTLAGLSSARASSGQVVPVRGTWPLLQRRPVGVNLCAFERRDLLRPGELGIDPELGRWALPPGDPLIGEDGFTVDYVEAFPGPIGARTFDRQLESERAATRIVSRSGDAGTTLPVHATLAAAVAAAAPGDVIEIADSATYAEPATIDISIPLVIRAAQRERPCLTFYDSGTAAPLAASLRVIQPIDELECNGLLMSGGPIAVDGKTKLLAILACTLDPLPQEHALVVDDADPAPEAAVLVCRSITGGLRIHSGPSLTVADSIVDRQRDLAIAGLPIDASDVSKPRTAAGAGRVQLERVTLLGRLRCDILNASECILDEVAVVDDRQAGCIRYSRYEAGPPNDLSVLPRRFQCVPDEATAKATPPHRRAVAPLFNSRRSDRCDYAQLAFASARAIETASEERSEVGAFARVRNPIRLANARTKLREFMPAGLAALFIAET